MCTDHLDGSRQLRMGQGSCIHLAEPLSVGEKEKIEPLANLVSHSAEYLQLPFSRGVGRIVKPPMNWFGAREDWACLFGPVADSDYKVELLIGVRGHIL